MRGFFLLLLLTNIAFLGWQYLQQGEHGEVSPYSGIHIDKKGLTLLSELPADKRPGLREGIEGDTGAEPNNNTVKTEQESGIEKEPVAQSQENKPEDATVCFKVSNIEGREQVDKLLSSLKRIGAGTLQEGSEQGQDTNYWVMLPPYPSREKAAAAAELLKKKQVKDFFIVRSGEYENAVSLGVFSTKERAERRYNQVIALKARLRKPKIEAIELPAKRYWVSYKLAERQQRTAADSLVKQLGQDSNKEISCK